MNFKRNAFISGFAVLLFSFSALAQDPVVRIPLKTFIKPTFDLQDSSGKKVYSSELEALYRQGVDLSKFNPVENKYWQNKKFPAIDTQLQQAMPAVNSEVVFDDYLGANRDLGIFSIYIRPNQQSNQRYGLTFGLQIHSSLTKAALLRKLGVYQESPKYLSSITLKFSSAQQMDEFVNKSFCEAGPSEVNIDCLSLEPFKRGFITDLNKEKNTLVLHGAYLEKLNPEFPGIFDGLTPATPDNVLLFAQSRAYRSLVVPFVIADLGESLNRVSSQSVAIRGGWAYLNFLNNTYFDGFTSSDDVKWMLRRLAALTDQDWDEIVEAGGFPKSLKTLVKAKLLNRTKNMMESFFDKSEQNQLLQVQIPSIKEINSGDGIVVNGKVTTQTIDGYPQRFAHGDRQSPFETADLIKYMKIKTQSSVLQVALDKFNTKLVKASQTQNIEGIEFAKNGQILPIGSVSGTSAGLNFSAERLITTGTYYGSQAAVQMVDNVTLSAAFGYNNISFFTEGLSKNFGANTAYIRNYTHVTPLDSIKETSKIPWSQLRVKSKLKQMTSPLDDGKLTEFLMGLKTGEVFTISDSIGIMGRVGWSSALDVLIGFVSAGQPSLGISADANGVLLRQVQFTKTKEGLQIFVRNGNSEAFGAQFDANYYINLLRIRSQTTRTQLHTNAYMLNYNSELMAKVEKGELTPDENLQKIIDQQKAASQSASKATKQLIFKSARALGVIRDLFFQSSVEKLDYNFNDQVYSIDHQLLTKEIQTKVLWHRANQLSEEHLLSILKPTVKAPEGSQVENKPIQVVTFRKGMLQGTDPLGFGLEVTDYVLQKSSLGESAPRLSQNSQNPSQMPFGKAKWRMIRSDTELTQDRVGALPSVSVIDHVWSGWSLKKPQLQSILQDVKENMKGTKFADYPLIPNGVLDQVTKIDFYKITSHLTLLPSAVDKIKEIVLANDTSALKEDHHTFVGRLFKKLSEIGGKARAQDQVVFKNLIRMLGNGDEETGLRNYNNQCQINKNNQYTYQWLNGTGYECLEPWTEKILKLSRQFPKDDLRAQNRWMTEVLFVLDEQIPQAYLLNELGQDKFIYYAEFTGFRAGDEDGDDGTYISNVLGEPEKKSEYANGLINILAQKSNIIPIELMPTKGSFE